MTHMGILQHNSGFVPYAILAHHGCHENDSILIYGT